MQKKYDFEAQLFMYLLRLKEEKNKKYSSQECEYDIVYKFDNELELKNYFINNGCMNANNDSFLDIFKFKTTKKGTVIAFKGLCDYAITRTMQSNLNIIDNEIQENKSKTRVLK